MWAFAVIIALSRVVIQAHFASDVIAAAFVGAFGAVLVRNWFAARRLAFTVDRQGTVGALPGPSLHRIKMVARRLFGQ
jgi:undecaprenyl-diphosphatase